MKSQINTRRTLARPIKKNYYITYIYEDGYNSGEGAMETGGHRKYKTYSQIKDMQKEIAESEGFRKVLITNIMEL